MGTLIDEMRQIGQQATSMSGDNREQAIIDRHKKGARSESLFQDIAEGMAELEIDTRRQHRAYAEKTTPEVAEPVKEILSSTMDRPRMLTAIRKLSPEQRAEALKLAPGIAQQIGDDRGGAIERIGGSVARGVSSFSQPIMELAGKVTGTDVGGTPEEIAFIRQMEGAAQEFSPARPDDPWYQRFPLQAAEMTVNAVPMIMGGIAGKGVATAGGQLLARGAAAGVPGAKVAFQATGAVGKIPKLIGLKGATTKGTMAGLGTVAGITAAGFPGQYAQEIDQLKELGMKDGFGMQSLAVGTALITSSLESIMPNPLKGVLPAGSVSLKEGAIKAARQYLWEAAKRAPAELSEEYAQGLSSGLGKVVAHYIDKNAKEKSIADAFKIAFEQGNAAIGPMAFMLGVPAVIGAGRTAYRAKGATLPPPPGEIRDTVSQNGPLQSVLGEDNTSDQQAPPPGTPPGTPIVSPPVQTPSVAPNESETDTAIPITDGANGVTTPTPQVGASRQDILDRVEQLKEVSSKGYVRKDEGPANEIEGDTRTEIMDNAKNELAELEEQLAHQQDVTDTPPSVTPTATPVTTPPTPSDIVSPTEQSASQEPAAQESPVKPGWDVVLGQDETRKEKLYREDPNPKLTSSQRLATRVAVDPSEGPVLITKDNSFPNKPILDETLKARKAFIDEVFDANTGEYKEGTTFRRPTFNKNALFEVGKDGKIYSIEPTTKRESSSVQDLVNRLQPGDATEFTSPSKTSPAEKVPPVEPATNAATPQQSYWDRMKQEGKPGKEAMRQTVVDEANKMISASKDAANFSTFADKQDSGKVDAYRGILQESGFEVGPVSYNEKEGTASWSIAQAKPQKRPDRKDNPSEAKSGDIVSQEPKRDQEVKDAPQTTKGGGPNEVQTKAEADALSKGQVSSKGEQAAVETPSPASSVPIKSSPTPSRQPSELQSPAEYRATLTKPTIKAIDLTTSQLTDMEIKHDLLEISKVDGTTQRDVFNQERRLSAQLKQLLDCLGK